MNIPGPLARLIARARQQQSVLRFCLLFGVYSVVAFTVLYGLQDQVVEPFTRGIAWITYKLMRAFGTPVSLNGVTLSVPNFSVLIRNNCNAAYEMGLYTAATLAYPAPLIRRTSGILFAVVVLYVVNLIRVMSLVYMGYLFPGFFDAAHVYVWQVLFLVAVAALWLSWISRVRPVA
ncbi:MAG TPA: exosortase H [Candidatus Methylomirabilis sp.]|nr:exosortase H [Candidatus Methylomirabilis sp.]